MWREKRGTLGVLIFFNSSSSSGKFARVMAVALFLNKASNRKLFDKKERYKNKLSLHLQSAKCDSFRLSISSRHYGSKNKLSYIYSQLKISWGNKNKGWGGGKRQGIEDGKMICNDSDIYCSYCKWSLKNHSSS